MRSLVMTLTFVDVDSNQAEAIMRESCKKKKKTNIGKGQISPVLNQGCLRAYLLKKKVELTLQSCGNSASDSS